MVKPCCVSHCLVLSCFIPKALHAGRRHLVHYRYIWDRAPGSTTALRCSLMLPRSRDSIVLVPSLLQSTMEKQRHPHKMWLLYFTGCGWHLGWLKALLPVPVWAGKWASSKTEAPAAAKWPACINFCFPSHSGAASMCTWHLWSFVQLHSFKKLHGLQFWVKEFFTSFVKEHSQHDVMLQYFWPNTSFSFCSFDQILKNALSGTHLQEITHLHPSVLSFF